MVSNDELNRFAKQIENDVLELNIKILESKEENSEVMFRILEVLDKISYISDTEYIFSPTYISFISLLKCNPIYKNSAISIMLNKIDTDIAYYYTIHNSSMEIELNPNIVLTEKEREYFVVDENNKLKINDHFNPNGRKYIMFPEKEADGSVWKKKYKIDLKTGYVIDFRKIKVINENGLDVSEPYFEVDDLKKEVSKEEFDNLVSEIFDNIKKSDSKSNNGGLNYAD